MRIPTNSNFSREIAKRFETIFHREMSLGGLQDLQEQSDLSYNPIYINPVDSYLANQVIKLEKDHAKTNLQTSGTIRQEYTKRKSLVGKVTEIEREKQKVSLGVTSS